MHKNIIIKYSVYLAKNAGKCLFEITWNIGSPVEGGGYVHSRPKMAFFRLEKA